MNRLQTCLVAGILLLSAVNALTYIGYDITLDGDSVSKSKLYLMDIETVDGNPVPEATGTGAYSIRFFGANNILLFTKAHNATKNRIYGTVLAGLDADHLTITTSDGVQIYSEDASHLFCNNDSICQWTETSKNCPSDCQEIQGERSLSGTVNPQDSDDIKSENSLSGTSKQQDGSVKSEKLLSDAIKQQDSGVKTGKSLTETVKEQDSNGFLQWVTVGIIGVVILSIGLLLLIGIVIFRQCSKRNRR